MKTFHSFKDIYGFEKYLRTKHNTCKHNGKYGGCIDYVTIGGKVFTMHEYDESGKSVTWANKKLNLMVEAETSNRYQSGYYDAKVTDYYASYLRNDISYAQ